jgi:hypothetical protein
MLRISTVEASAALVNAGTIEIANARIINLRLIVVTFNCSECSEPNQSKLMGHEPLLSRGS